MRTLKYTYLLVIQGNYGCGWEDESQYNAKDREERKQARADLREYRFAAPEYGHRLINRRELANTQPA